MAFTSLPTNALDFMDWPWERIHPYFNELEQRPLNSETIAAWLVDWSQLSALLHERQERLVVATTVDTTNEQARQSYNRYLDEVYPAAQAAQQHLKQKLLASGVTPLGFEIPLRNMRADAALFRQENLPLLSAERKLSTEYDKIVGAQTVEWQGDELTIAQLKTVLKDPDRTLRERAWRMLAARQLADRGAINDLWVKFMDLRSQLAANAGYQDYRAFRWQQLLRFDYRPEDCYNFHQAIEEVVVPAARRVYARRQRSLGIGSVRPWDTTVDPLAQPPLKPFDNVEELESKTTAVFDQVDPQLGVYFATMRREGLLDLANRKGKAPGAYCTEFPASQRPFIFANAVGMHIDVLTLLHEGGHAFHVFESAHLPYYQQLQVPVEFAEVASMGMELLAAPFLLAEKGGFYTEQEAARALVENLEETLLFWPYMAVVDAFQHWVYTHHRIASDPSNCDAQWAKLWQRFMVGEDWSGLEPQMATGWQRKLHIHQDPFYYIEYGLAQLGAVQVWRNALQDQTAAVKAYRSALALGGTRPLPELFAAAGARLAFDARTLSEAVELIEETIAQLTRL